MGQLTFSVPWRAWEVASIRSASWRESFGLPVVEAKRQRQGVGAVALFTTDHETAQVIAADFDTHGADLAMHTPAIRAACRRAAVSIRARLARSRLDSPQHRGDRPHGVGCPGCRSERACNECGAEIDGQTKRCVSGRCLVCCTRVCRHATGQGATR